LHCLQHVAQSGVFGMDTKQSIVKRDLRRSGRCLGGCRAGRRRSGRCLGGRRDGCSG
jgi:hypothetical protein